METVDPRSVQAPAAAGEEDADDAALFDELASVRDRLNDAIATRIVGQRHVVEQLLVALFARGHCLFVGVPGLAKTLLVNTTAQVLGLEFGRVQFTPDLMPADITGTEILQEDRSTGRRVMRFIPGPVFTNLLLADEINRTPPKTQAALLQAMQELQVTAAGRTYELKPPFLVFATQNPIEQEGTYPLPEAQLDRFMLKVMIGYPSREEEIKVIDRMAGSGTLPEARPVITPEDVLAARQVTETVFVDDKVKGYVVDLVAATRDPGAMGLDSLVPLIENGASVRASINLVKVAKAHAVLQGRTYVTPHDVKTIAPDVLRHRLVITYEAEAQGKTADDIVRFVLDNVEVP